jgi:hypothetical protein
MTKLERIKNDVGQLSDKERNEIIEFAQTLQSKEAKQNGTKKGKIPNLTAFTTDDDIILLDQIVNEAMLARKKSRVDNA